MKEVLGECVVTIYFAAEAGSDLLYYTILCSRVIYRGKKSKMICTNEPFFFICLCYFSMLFLLYCGSVDIRLRSQLFFVFFNKKIFLSHYFEKFSIS